MGRPAVKEARSTQWWMRGHQWQVTEALEECRKLKQREKVKQTAALTEASEESRRRCGLMWCAL